MSTKIFNGYRIPAEGFLHRVRGLRPAIVATMSEHAKPMLAQLALNLHLAREEGVDDPIAYVCDDATWGQVSRSDLMTSEKASLHIMACHVLAVLNRHLANGRARRRVVGFDLTCSAAFMADPEDHSWVYSTLYDEQSRYEDTFVRVMGAEPWPYWNSSDGPDGVSVKAWKERGKTWNRVLGGGSPALVGATWKLSGLDLDMLALNGLMSVDEFAEVVAEMGGGDAGRGKVDWWVDRLNSPV